MILICKILSLFYLKMLYARLGFKTGPLILEKNFTIYISHNVFSLFRNYLPLKKDIALPLYNWNPHHPRMLLPSLVEISPWFSRVLISSMYFRYLLIIMPPGSNIGGHIVFVLYVILSFIGV